MNSNLIFGSQNSGDFQVAVSTLTLGTLYEAILTFSGQDNERTFWPEVCNNARWLIPSRRMSILLAKEENRYEVVCRFERGKVAENNTPLFFSPVEKSLRQVFSGVNTCWYEQPLQQLSVESGEFRDWLLRDEYEMLFIVPLRVKSETLGVLAFVTGTTAPTDQAMLNTLGTIYALHAGMTYQMININNERRQMQNRMMMQEKMAALGNLVAGVAHEVNNPIGAINAAADVNGRCVTAINELADDADDSEEQLSAKPRFRKALKLIEQNTGVIKTAGDRIARIVKSLKAFARLDEADYQNADIHEGIIDTLTLLGSRLSTNINVEKAFGDIGMINCCPAQLNQVFMHLLLNAIDAVEGKGAIKIATRAANGAIIVEVNDDGKGIPADELEKIFEPGFTTKGVGVGTGLGLAICYRIVREHGGSISVDSTPGSGSTFSIELPVNK